MNQVGYSTILLDVEKIANAHEYLSILRQKDHYKMLEVIAVHPGINPRKIWLDHFRHKSENHCHQIIIDLRKRRLIRRKRDGINKRYFINMSRMYQVKKALSNFNKSL